METHTRRSGWEWWVIGALVLLLAGSALFYYIQNERRRDAESIRDGEPLLRKTEIKIEPNGFTPRRAARTSIPGDRLRFTKAMAKPVRKGMTEAEVVAVLGCPAGWYADPKTSYIGSGPMGYWIHPEGWTLPAGNVHKGWIGDAGAIVVEFDRDGRVVWSSWHMVDSPRVPTSTDP